MAAARETVTTGVVAVQCSAMGIIHGESFSMAKGETSFVSMERRLLFLFLVALDSSNNPFITLRGGRVWIYPFDSLL